MWLVFRKHKFTICHLSKSLQYVYLSTQWYNWTWYVINLEFLKSLIDIARITISDAGKYH